MTRGRPVWCLGLIVVIGLGGCGGRDRQSAEELQAAIAVLEAEHESLRTRLLDAVQREPRLAGMPDDPVRLGVPTAVARTLVERLVAAMAGRVTIHLRDLSVHRAGDIRRVVPIGHYDLHLRVTTVTARLQAGRPAMTFGGNEMRVTLPVRLASGTGTAEVDFLWEGRNIAGAVCGDMHVVEKVTGRVRPASYRVNAGLRLAATAQGIRLTPRIPPLRVHVQVEPSAESWQFVQDTLDGKGGVCGFVLDRVNIRESLEGLMARGFEVRVPVERIRPVTLPVAIEPTFAVGDDSVQLNIQTRDLVVTSDMIWFGATITIPESPGTAGAR